MADQPAKKRRLLSSPETCCSSTESTQSSDLTKEVAGIADPEDENSTCGSECGGDINQSTREEKAGESGEMESTVRAEKPVKEEKMPTEAELEEFFAAAEKQIHQKFADKYNFDISKDQPLEGRFEWTKVKP